MNCIDIRSVFLGGVEMIKYSFWKNSSHNNNFFSKFSFFTHDIVLTQLVQIELSGQ
jgi:hypothetical protein